MHLDNFNKEYIFERLFYSLILHSRRDGAAKGARTQGLTALSYLIFFMTITVKISMK